MRYHNGKRLFSATDLMNYVGCTHSTWLDLHCPPEQVAESEIDPEAQLLFEKGIAHERRYLDSLTAEGLHITTIAEELLLDERFLQTIKAMERGDAVVYQAAITRDDLHGFVDFLRRIDQPSRFGSHGYEILDTKLGQTPKPKYLVQLCVYAYLLEFTQGRLPESVSLMLGNSKKPELFRVADFIHYINLARERFGVFVAKPPSSSRPEPNAHCNQCRWQKHCQTEWQVTDHLSNIANIQRAQVRKLNDAGIQTVQQLVEAAPLPNVRIGSVTLSRLHAQAELQKHKQKTSEDRVELITPLEPDRGFYRLPKPDQGDLFFDMEGEPHYPDGLEYLFGFCFLADGNPTFRSFWAHSRPEEKTAFEAVMEFLDGWTKHHPQAYIYHYNHYEPTALKRLADWHGVRDRRRDSPSHVSTANGHNCKTSYACFEFRAILDHMQDDIVDNVRIENLEFTRIKDDSFNAGRSCDECDNSAEFAYWITFGPGPELEPESGILCGACAAVSLLQETAIEHVTLEKHGGVVRARR